MSTRSAWCRWFGIGALLVGMAAPAWANEGSPSYMQGALRKLGRGAANVVSFPLELIRTPELVGQKDGYPAALSVGLLQGVWNGIVRGVSGVTDIVTCFVEFPKQDFAPIVQP